MLIAEKSDLNLTASRRDMFLPSELYHENSKYDRYLSLPNFINIANLRKNHSLLKLISQAYRCYPDAFKIKLPPATLKSKKSFEEVVLTRRSTRNFGLQPLSLEKLSALLHFTYGITGEFSFDFDAQSKQALRAAPSAGALYPLEIFPMVLNVNDVEKGIYHYQVLDHSLECLIKEDFSSKVSALFTEQQFLEKAAVVFIIAAIFKRASLKYKERGYRFVLLDAGHLAQNFYLTANAYDLGAVAVGGFYERELEELLEIDGVEESMIYALAAGEKALEPRTREGSDE